MKKYFKSKFKYFSLVIILIINILLKVPIQAQGYFAFAYDQGRDFLEVSKIIYDHKFTLIGPTTGLPGIFYGPWWYYFLSPILFVSRGDPQIVAIFFSAFGIITTLLLYFLIKSITRNVPIALALTIAASMSSYWFGPTSIWSPSLVPVFTIFYIFTIKRIIDTKKAIYYFFLGISIFLITDSETAFGVAVIIAQIAGTLIYRKTFINKNLLLTFLGGSIILAPRIIFDLRHNLLISKSILAYIDNPVIQASNLTFANRLPIRLNQIFSVITDALFESHRLIAILLILLILILFLFALNQKKVFILFKKDLFFHYLIFTFMFILLAFSIFKDNVWNYYLIGLPVIFICILAKAFEYILKIQSLKLFAILLFLALLVTSYNSELHNFGKITWEGDDATYKNPKAVVEYLATQKPTNYSLYAYSHSIFDYPIDYLVSWYGRNKLLEKPKVNQNTIYLIIRDDETHRYKREGWDLDKTKNKTFLLEQKRFNGNFILEKHIKHD